MALLDTLNELRKAAPKCRIERLLATVDSEDALTLREALIKPSIKHHVLTAALRKEYGQDSVTDKSVGEWRRKNLTELTGL